MKPRRPDSDAKNGVTVRHCEGAGSELNLPKGSWIHWMSLNQMDEIFKVGIKNRKKANQKLPHPAPNSYTCQNIIKDRFFKPFISKQHSLKTELNPKIKKKKVNKYPYTNMYSVLDWPQPFCLFILFKMLNKGYFSLTCADTPLSPTPRPRSGSFKKDITCLELWFHTLI